MRRLTLALLILAALAADASAFGRCRRCKARSATAASCQAAPVARPAYLPETLRPAAPPVLTGPVVTAVRQCAGGVCPK